MHPMGGTLYRWITYRIVEIDTSSMDYIKKRDTTDD